jgi:hypothetical protein
MSKTLRHRSQHGIPPDMVSKIDADRYADTGFSVADTPPELNAFLFQQMMRKSGAERLAIGCRMTDSARELVWSGIPMDLPAEERRTAFLQRFYGDSLNGIPCPLPPPGDAGEV